MNGPKPPETAGDSPGPDPIAAAHARLRRDDKGRYLCALFAPQAHRAALLALYDFNLEIARVRETVSDPMVGQLRLKWWHDALARFDDGDPPKHPVALALFGAVRAGGLDIAALQGLVEARAADLAPDQPTDMAALRAYAAQTAGAIHDLALTLLGAPAPDAARHLSAAWAYVGLLRAQPFHAVRGWLYLPAAVCAAAGLDAGEALQARPGRPSPPALRATVARIAEEAAAELASARRLRPGTPSAAQPVMLLAVLADHELWRLRDRDWDPALVAAEPAGPGPGALLRLGWHGLIRRY